MHTWIRSASVALSASSPVFTVLGISPSSLGGRWPSTPPFITSLVGKVVSIRLMDRKISTWGAGWRLVVLTIVCSKCILDFFSTSMYAVVVLSNVSSYITVMWSFLPCIPPELHSRSPQVRSRPISRRVTCSEKYNLAKFKTSTRCLKKNHALVLNQHGEYF